MPTYNTMADIRQSNKDAGFFFFSRGAMRFFRSVVACRKPYIGKGGVYFVTSECERRASGDVPRGYTVRKFDTLTANVTTVGAFQGYSTAQDARDDAKAFAKGEA